MTTRGRRRSVQTGSSCAIDFGLGIRTRLRSGGLGPGSTRRELACQDRHQPPVWPGAILTVGVMGAGLADTDRPPARQPELATGLGLHRTRLTVDAEDHRLPRTTAIASV